jgi:hypothetical protein
MRHLAIGSVFFALTGILFGSWCAPVAQAEIRGGGALRIEWEVKNRFRLFRNEADFQRQVDVTRGEGVLAAEQRLARETDGRGWARDVVERLCVDRAGNLLEYCDRDGEREVYMAPRDHRIGAALAGTLPENQGCVWSFDDGERKPQQTSAPCSQEVKVRVRYGRTTLAAVDIVLPDGTTQRLVSDIAVRDLLIAGMGDSVAAGEGNPDRAIRLSDEGFCFKRFDGDEYFRPGRAGFNGNKSCSTAPGEDMRAGDWARHSARWLSGACHRSLYSYQIRATLALAIESPHTAVTFIPLGCSGTTVNIGFLGTLRILDCPVPGSGGSCPRINRPQVAELIELMETARRHSPERSLDLVLLTIGANDVLVSWLMTNVIVQPGTERSLLTAGGVLVSVEESQRVLERELPGDFAKLRAALKPFVRGNLSRVVFVTYGNPAMSAANRPCPGGRDGFDVHPAFAADGDRLRQVVEFMSKRFLPGIKALARCEDRRTCRDPMTETMRFVDAHQPAFIAHGVCARSKDDPVFDRECFSSKGDTFRSGRTTAATDPMTCGRSASEFRPYASRARWVRTANDSYLTSMTYPEGLPALLQPSDLHDAIWGIIAAVYGGAVHPTAEGHAAMADAALPAIRETLGLATAETPIRSAPVAAPAQLHAPQHPVSVR